MRKRVPHFWWDFTREATAIIVESDEPQYPILAHFYITGDDAMPQIEQAEKLIEDLRAGRISPKNAVAELRGKRSK
jgi:hypothetical protein